MIYMIYSKTSSPDGSASHFGNRNSLFFDFHDLGFRPFQFLTSGFFSTCPFTSDWHRFDSSIISTGRATAGAGSSVCCLRASGLPGC